MDPRSPTLALRLSPAALFRRTLLAVALVAVASCGSDDAAVASTSFATEPTAITGLLEPAQGDDERATETELPVADAEVEAALPAGPTPTAALPAGTVELLRPEIIESFPHDNTAYTQGLEVIDGDLFESTGRQAHPGGDVVYESDLRRVDLATGEVIQRADAPGTVFAEGLTKVGDELIQLTWQDQVAFYWDAESFEFIREVAYEGQGWGLCFDGEHLIMSDGSSTLFFRDPATFDLIGQVAVTQSGTQIASLNELECVDGKVWANIYRTDFVVRIDPSTGFVDGIVDASALEQPRTMPTEVLNGIAWDPETQTWLMTGKFWPTMYRVRFVADGLTN